MGLFTSAWLSENEGKALKAVSKLTDQQKLMAAATKNKHEAVRLQAVAKLTDQQMLSEVIRNNYSEKVYTAAMDRISDETILLKLAKEIDGDTVRVEAVKRLCNQRELLSILMDDPSAYVRAEAILKLDKENLDLDYLIKIAVSAVSKPLLPSPEGLAAVERIDDEHILYHIAVESEDYNVQSAAIEKVADANLLTEFLIQTDDSFLFREMAKRVKDPTLRKKITEQAQITDKNVLKDLMAPEELLQKCLETRDASLVEGVYKETWDVAVLTQLANVCDDNETKERLNLRIKTVENITVLREKGMPAELNAESNEYITALETDINRYMIAKRTTTEQGRYLGFDAVYNKPDLQAAVLEAVGISLQYFHGGPLMSGLLFSNFGKNLEENAKEAIWIVIARLQLANSEEVLKRLKPELSQQEAERLLYDILKLWYETLS